MLDKKQFEDLIKRILIEYDLYNKSAVNLLLGTAAQESKFGTYIRQINGPALGIFQMEKPTFDWLKNIYGSKYPIGEFDELEYNLKQAILLARLRYRIVPKPLPDADDIEGLAKYWKEYYNTPLGKGKIEQFINNYKKYIKGEA